MFMLRCGFWLSVMFASLPIVPGMLGDRRGPPGAAFMTKDAVLAQTGSWCAARSGQCERDAARLTALVVAMAGGSDPHLDGTISAAVEPATPARRRAAKTVLTDGR